MYSFSSLFTNWIKCSINILHCKYFCDILKFHYVLSNQIAVCYNLHILHFASWRNITMSINNIGRDIKALRAKRGIGSRELSRLIGKAETYISQLERGLIKKLDYTTAYAVMKHLGFTESGIDEFLDSFYQIKSPARIEVEAEQRVNLDEVRAAEIEQMWIQRREEIDTDREYQVNKLENDMINLESQWMMNLYERLENDVEEIRKELLFNIGKNIQTFEPVINNLLSLLTSMRKDRGNFELFVGLFKSDLSVLSEKSKERIIEATNTEIFKRNQDSTQI